MFVILQYFVIIDFALALRSHGAVFRCTPSIMCGGVVRQQARLAWLIIEVLAVRPPLDRIIIVKKPAPPQFRQEELYDILKTAGRNRIRLFHLA